jgi:hypothetical protein
MKQIREGAIIVSSIRDMLQTEFRLDPYSAEVLIHKWLPGLYSDPKKCPNCGAGMVEFIFSIDCLDVVLLYEMAKVVRDNVYKGQRFSEANQVHVPSLATHHSVKCRTTKCSKLGLIAKVREANGRHKQGFWLITTRGWDFLKGEPVPAKVAVFRKKIIERFNEIITIDEAKKVRYNLIKSQNKKEYIENALRDFDKSQWYDFRNLNPDIYL